MKRPVSFLFVVVLVLTTAAAARADDGSWNKRFALSGGSVYSENEEPDVSLARELLVFDGKRTHAYFVFRNHADRPVTVTCGFPVIINIEANEQGGVLLIPTGSYGYGLEIPGLQYLSTQELPSGEEYRGYHSRQIPINDRNNSREFLGAGVMPEGVELTIHQDGKRVPIHDVLLERHASAREGARVTFHYKHELRFPAAATSVVEVEYTYDMVRENLGAGIGFQYRWDYRIGTGGTWRGPIGSFFFVHPADWTGEIEGLPQLISKERAVRVYGKSDYEPLPDEHFVLTRSELAPFVQEDGMRAILRNCFEKPVTLAPPPSRPAQSSLIRNVGASSSLRENVNLFRRTGVIPGASFAPSSLFDGIPESAWCEGVDGPGIGEYVSFEAVQTLWGIEIRNGFNRMLLSDQFYESERFEEKYRDDSRGLKDYYELNNRPKQLAITDESGRVLYSLQLEDSREPQVFAHVKLDPGRYRLVIRSVYPGTQWDDTCLGEVTFLSSLDGRSAATLRALADDDLFREALQDLVF